MFAYLTIHQYVTTSSFLICLYIVALNYIVFVGNEVFYYATLYTNKKAINAIKVLWYASMP